VILFKYDDYEVGYKLLKIAEDYEDNKSDKSECGNYKGISWVSVASKLLRMMIIFRFRDAIDKV